MKYLPRTLRYEILKFNEKRAVANRSVLTLAWGISPLTQK